MPASRESVAGKHLCRTFYLAVQDDSSDDIAPTKETNPFENCRSQTVYYVERRIVIARDTVA